MTSSLKFKDWIEQQFPGTQYDWSRAESVEEMFRDNVVECGVLCLGDIYDAFCARDPMQGTFPEEFDPSVFTRLSDSEQDAAIDNRVPMNIITISMKGRKLLWIALTDDAHANITRYFGARWMSDIENPDLFKPDTVLVRMKVFVKDYKLLSGDSQTTLLSAISSNNWNAKCLKEFDLKTVKGKRGENE